MIQAQPVKISHLIAILILKLKTMTTILINLTMTNKMMIQKSPGLTQTQAAMQHGLSQKEQVTRPR